ncbi:beta-ketoacyl synthase N-terminal-like domain-containing protein [Allomuricauda sp. SCSIO 65647]|uniref:beta-ketoacyl synthase N-terminal-like domain-containing protein n=1 Tax=Allomuricauda sp. SCSIO 65647 TaxID=2908843 RepID=UPI003918930A
MLKVPIYITALSSISSLGSSSAELWKSYQNKKHFLSKADIGEQAVWVSELLPEIREEIKILRHQNEKYKSLDDSVLFAIYTSRKAIENAGWGKGSRFGINIGSSRGATALFEQYHKEFLNDGKTATLTSPTTTLGNISSWVAHDLKSHGPEISHSITCSTSLHAVLNAVAWLQSGLADKFLVGGSEASLTPFTIAQMQALKIYAMADNEYPCRALDFDKRQNTMVLGEAAAMACLEKSASDKALAAIVGIGYATEPLQHNVSLSTEAHCFQDSMKMALGELAPEVVDVVIMHAPGTVKGDEAEFKAVEKIFGENIPAIVSNKWKVGHTFGASGMLSLEMALLMMQHQKFVPTPFFEQKHPEKIKYAMVNAVGFGGNAVSILLKATNVI